MKGQIKSVEIQQARGTNREATIAEVKGAGHPDTVADQLAETAAAWYNRKCADLGVLLPYKFDKISVFGEGSAPIFGGGELQGPIHVLLRGTITTSVRFGGAHPTTIIHEALFDELQDVLTKRILRVTTGLSSDQIIFHEHLKRSHATVDWRMLDQKLIHIPTINEDSSVATGYAPLGKTEQLGIRVEQFLANEAPRDGFLGLGEERKILVLCSGGAMKLVASCAMISSHVQSFEDYRHQIQNVALAISKQFDIGIDSLLINNFDSVSASQRRFSHTGLYGAEAPSVYILVTGSHIEKGSGAVGRGNRLNGCITPEMPQSMEAWAGKMPTHPGRLYTLIANRTAHCISAAHGEVYCAVHIASTIGNPIMEPTMISVELNDGDLTSADRDLIYHQLRLIPWLVRQQVNQVPLSELIHA